MDRVFLGLAGLFLEISLGCTAVLESLRAALPVLEAVLPDLGAALPVLEAVLPN